MASSVLSIILYTSHKLPCILIYMIACKECGHECSAQNALSYHLKTHSLTYTDYLVKHEYTGIWPTCQCGSKLSYKKGGFPRFCSKSCASSGTNNPMHGKTGDKSPIYGIRRTAEQLKNYSVGSKKRWEKHGDKLREMMKTPEYSKANSEAQKMSYVKDPSLRQKRREGVHRFWSTSPFAALLRKEAADRAVKLLEAGLIGPQAPFKTQWILNPFTGQEEFMHSSWETSFLEAAVARGYKVTKAHGITIPYTHPDGSQRTYVPDFYAPDDRVLYEVKGRHDEVDEAKWAAAETFCRERGMKFAVLFEESDMYEA